MWRRGAERRAHGAERRVHGSRQKQKECCEVAALKWSRQCDGGAVGQGKNAKWCRDDRKEEKSKRTKSALIKPPVAVALEADCRGCSCEHTKLACMARQSL